MSLTCLFCDKQLVGKQVKYCSDSCKNKIVGNYALQGDRGTKRKLFFINQFGAKCQRCNYNRNSAALCFHHINPADKEFEVDKSSLSNRKIEALALEIQKCILLCANCHMEEHYPQGTIFHN